MRLSFASFAFALVVGSATANDYATNDYATTNDYGGKKVVRKGTGAMEEGTGAPTTTGKAVREVVSTVRMADGTLQRMSDIHIGDEVAKGGLVTSIMSFANNGEGLCRIDESLVATKMRMMLDPQSGGFVPARKLAKEHNLCKERVEVVYDIDTEKHVIEFESGIVATDYNEHEIIPEFSDIEKEMALDKAKSVAEVEPDSLFLYNVDFAGETLITMEDGSFKAIEDIELNDVVSLGGRVTGVFKIDGSSEERLCRVAPHVVVCEEYLVYLHGAFVEGDYALTCGEAPAKTLYHLDTVAHLVELKGNVFSVDYEEHSSLPEFIAKEMEMTKDLVKIAKAM
jgi:hypothetical protein